MEVDKVADMVADNKEIKKIDIDINMEIHCRARVGHGGWLIGPQLFQPKAYPACASSRLCEFIFQLHLFSFVLSLCFSLPVLPTTTNTKFSKARISLHIL